MTENIWFTSDTHFGHRGILTLGRGRPFDSVDEMDEAMIERWNAMVAPTDRIYHLGDFSFYNSGKTAEIISRLQGQKHYIKGNHDKPMRGKEHFFESFQDYKEIKVEDQRLVLFHFPVASWHQIGRGSWHLHGHCHGNLPDDGHLARMDVGVDTHNFYPWHYDEIVEVLKDRQGLPGDHHGSD